MNLQRKNQLLIIALLVAGNVILCLGAFIFYLLSSSPQTVTLQIAQVPSSTLMPVTNEPVRATYAAPASTATNQAFSAASSSVTPTIAPLKTNTPLVASSGSASSPTLGGCPIFPANNVWNTRIDTLPVDANSTTYINAIGANTSLHPDFGSSLWQGAPIGIPFNLVPGNQTLLPISFDYAGESDPGPYPIPPNPLLERGTDYHLLILDTGRCTLYETWDTHNSKGWTAGSGAKFDLKSNALRPIGWTSADAAGLPILPGLVRYSEVASGEIRHALRFTVNGTNGKSIWPARHKTSSLVSAAKPPMGQRFRLKASFDISSFSHDTQVILTAFKRYGIIVADNGSNWFITGAPDPHWQDETLVNEFRRIHGSDFEAVDESSLMLDPNSGQVR